jgi:hypothetical protein
MCRNGSDCTFLHLDPNHPQGCINIPPTVYNDRKPIIDRLLIKLWPDCDALLLKNPVQRTDMISSSPATLLEPLVSAITQKTDITKAIQALRNG